MSGYEIEGEMEIIFVTCTECGKDVMVSLLESPVITCQQHDTRQRVE